MEAIFVHDGLAVDYTPSGGNVAAGEVVVLGAVCLIAKTPIARYALGAVATTGLFDVAKDSTNGLAFTAGDAVYWDDSANQATKTSTDVYMGVCVRDAAAADETVRVALRSLQEVVAEQLGLADLSDVTTATATAGNLLIGNGAGAFAAGKLGSTSLATVASGASGAPMLIRKVCVATGAEDVVVLASAPVKLLVCDAWLVARDNQAANVKLHSGTAGVDDITAAVAKGTGVDAIVRFATIVAAKDEVASAGAIKANFSAAGAADVFILAVPIA